MKTNPTFNSTNVENYIPIGSDYFCLSTQHLINSDCMIATGRTYILVLYKPNDGLQALYVRLTDAFYLNVRMHIILKDLLSERRITIVHNINNESNECTWKLIDWKYYQKKVEDEIIMSYCNCD